MVWNEMYTTLASEIVPTQVEKQIQVRRPAGNSPRHTDCKPPLSWNLLEGETESVCQLLGPLT
jgi:hypothetical protein